MDEEMLPEYDFKNMKVVGMGSKRTQFGDVIKLEPDVAKVFKTAESVNTVLRALIAAMPTTAPQEEVTDSANVARSEKNPEVMAISS